MKLQRAALEDCAPQPWRNGGGVTRELLAWPAPADWRVRISVADVQADGPFSRFDGVERWFAVLQGPGVRLRMGDAAHVVCADGEPFRFDGRADVHCSLLGGATRDLNLMAPPGRSRMHRVRGQREARCDGRRLVALYTHAHPARLVLGTCSAEVAPGQLAWSLLDDASTARVEAADALWMEVTP